MILRTFWTLVPGCHGVTPQITLQTPSCQGHQGTLLLPCAGVEDVLAGLSSHGCVWLLSLMGCVVWSLLSVKSKLPTFNSHHWKQQRQQPSNGFHVWCWVLNLLLFQPEWVHPYLVQERKTRLTSCGQSQDLNPAWFCSLHPIQHKAIGFISTQWHIPDQN
jgi:hypothetical protein